MRRRISYGGRIPPMRFGIPWGPARLYYFRNYSARADADGIRGGFTSHGIHLRLQMWLAFMALLALAGFLWLGPIGAVAGALVIPLLSKKWRRRLGVLEITKNWTSGVLHVNPPGWGSFRVLPKRVERGR